MKLIIPKFWLQKNLSFLSLVLQPIACLFKIVVYLKKKFTKPNSDFINFFVDDSLNFLTNFKKKIDFLYLDSLDEQFEEASSHQLNEIQIAKKHLVKLL